MKRYIAIFILVALFAGSALLLGYLSEGDRSPNATIADAVYRQTPLSFGDHEFQAFVSDTPVLRTKGLGGFTGLKTDQAMLFVFDKDGFWQFWMKDMRFSIDMVWVGSDMRVVSIEKRVSPQTYPKNFSSSKPARYVVELSAGTAERIGLKIGDVMDIGG